MIAPNNSQKTEDLVLNWLPLVLLLGALALVWSNLFQNGFHFDDFHIIVNNRYVHSLPNIPHFFRDPRAFSSIREYAGWRPLLSATFALDYAKAHEAGPQLFLIDTFVWFIVLLFFVFVLFRIIPGGSRLSALFGTALVGLHPVTADTVNYISQRGAVFAALGIVMGLGGWITWPRLLPRRLDLGAPAVPKKWWDEFRKNLQPKLDAAWRRFIHAPLGFYLIPVLLALLASPGAAAFALILLAYVILLDSGRAPRQVIPAGILCAVLWIAPLAVTWKYGAQARPPLASYWMTQPLVAVRYLLTFLNPGMLTIDSGLQSVTLISGLGGLIGLGAIVALAIFAAKRVEWRPVAFGLWWFLLALIPDALVPQRDLEATPRMFVAMIGLAFALTRAGVIVFERFSGSEKSRLPALIAAAAAGVLLLAGFGWETSQRNAAWETEESIWHDAVDKNPRNGRAVVHYAEALIDTGIGVPASYDMMKQAAVRTPQDASIELTLARTATRLGREDETEAHYKRILAIQPAWASGYALYAEWLLRQLRIPEAIDNANKAIALQPDELDARRTLTDIYLERHDWDKVTQLAGDTLRFYPFDEDGTRAMSVAGIAMDEIKQEESRAASLGRNGYLALSVTYFKNQRYEDCIRAAREALKLDPNTGEAWANIATAYHAMGKLDESVDALKEAVRLSPDLVQAKIHLTAELEEQANRHKDKDGSKQ